MKFSRFIYIIAMTLMGLAIFVSCTEDNNRKDPSSSAQSHTLLYYFMGNETGLTEFMDDNIVDIRTAATGIISDDQHIAIFYDNGTKTHLTEYVKNEDGRTIEKTIHKFLNTTDCTKPEFMAEVFQMVMDSCGTDAYSVVFSSHGAGWVPEPVFVQYDYAYQPASIQSAAASPFYMGQDGDSYMEIPQMAEAIELSGIHFDFILFDACFMSSVEALYDLRNCADYIIASATEVIGYGFPYKDMLPLLLGNEGHQLEAACKVYIDFYKGLSGEEQSGNIALTKCSELENLAAAVKDVLAANPEAHVSPREAIGFEGFDSHLYCDLEDYIKHLNGGTVPQAFADALDKAVPYTDYTEKFYTNFGAEKGLKDLPSSCGLSCYIPDPSSSAAHVHNADLAYMETAWAKAIGAE